MMRLSLEQTTEKNRMSADEVRLMGGAKLAPSLLNGGGVEQQSFLYSGNSGKATGSTPIVSHVPASKVSVSETNSAGSSIVSSDFNQPPNNNNRSIVIPPPPQANTTNTHQHQHQQMVAPDSLLEKESCCMKPELGERISTQLPPSVDEGFVLPTSHTNNKRMRIDSMEPMAATRKVSLDVKEESNYSLAVLKKPRFSSLLACNSSIPRNTVGGDLGVQAVSLSVSEKSNINNSLQPLLLLAHPTDASVLSPLHVFVRQQVEVFTATDQDICQPAPGRKNRVQLHQVGLRCIHCRDVPPRDRVKRAVCYPSSVGRVYHSVSDMKFDHFTNCKAFPAHVRARFQELKVESKQKRSSSSKAPKAPSYMFSSTAQCYHDAACKMGMVDAKGGLFMTKDLRLPDDASIVTTNDSNNMNNNMWDHHSDPSRHHHQQQHQQLFHASSFVSGGATAAAAAMPEPCVDIAATSRIPILPKLIHNNTTPLPFVIDGYSMAAAFPMGLAAATQSPNLLSNLQNNNGNAIMSSLASYLYTLNSCPIQSESKIDQRVQQPIAAPASPPVARNVACSTTATATSSRSSTRRGWRLTAPLDEQHLNPLHCFVRRHIELFVADKDDMAAPAPGRKTRVVLGQVGLRCIHCTNLHPKDRVKRAVCYPAAVGGIYHSVSNMKFDHFDKCRGLPETDRAIFTALRSSCGRHGPRSSSGSVASNNVAVAGAAANSNSTAQYYHDSAFVLGLIDTDTGMRFQHCDVPSHVALANYAMHETAIAPKQDDPSQLHHKTATDGISALMIAASVRAAVTATNAEKSR